MKHIELFAGCGGLSLGLKSAGFNLILANEKSSMAAETFSYNLLGHDLEKINPNSKLLINDKEDFQDFMENHSDGYPRFHVGDILDLVKMCSEPSINFEALNIELVSGGPPCQGFSLAGLRKEKDPKNELPQSFLEFVNITRTRFVLLENVLGITQPFKKDGGVKYPWFELAKGFMSRGYIPFCYIVNARDFGIPQNRPRFIMFAVRGDQEKVLKKMANINIEYKLVIDFARMYLGKNEEDLLRINQSSLLQDKFPLINLDKNKDLKEFGFKFVSFENEVTTSDAIGDLSINPEAKQSQYVKKINELFAPNLNHPVTFCVDKQPHNFEKRNHSDRVKKRFSFLQVASKNNINLDFSKLDDFLIQDDLLDKYYKALVAEGLLEYRNGESAAKILEKNLAPLKTKKHSQAALKADKPSPAQLTIPDDYCHYSINEPRVLTVREMARIQSFPDNFVFRSKVTTGGLNRRIEVPQYTQVGNAVPPLLGYSFGKFIKNLV